MDQPITPTWTTVELPILGAVVQADLDGDDQDDAAIAAGQQLGLSDERTMRTLSALIDADYLVGTVHRAGDGEIFAVIINAPTARTRRLVGQWPTADGLAFELASAFDRAADVEDDVERKLSYREAAKAIVTGVATTAITKYMGL